MNIKPQPEASPGPRRRVGCLIWVAVAVVILIVLPLLAIVGWQARGALRVEEQKAAIRARDEPVSPQDLELMYVVPEGKEDMTAIWLNAVAGLETEEFKQAARGLPIVSDSQSQIPPPGQPWPQLAAAEELLKNYQASLQSLHEAADRGGAARYPVKFEEGMNAQLPHAQSLRAGARLLVLEAHVHADRKNAHAVAESIRALNRIGGSLEQEPIIVSLLVRLAVSGMSTQLCCQMLPHVEFSEEDLQRLSDEYRAARYSAGYGRALLGERVQGILAFENSLELGEQVPRGWDWAYNDDLALYLELMDLTIAAARRPYAQARAEYRALSQRLATTAGSGLSRFRYIRTCLILPALDAAAGAVARGDLQSDVALTAIAIERYRRQHVEWPERLEQLVPEFLTQVPTDPYDGRPVRYVVQPDQYLLYSVGQDGADNGGKGKIEPDIVFTVSKATR